MKFLASEQNETALMTNKALKFNKTMLTRIYVCVLCVKTLSTPPQ